MRPGEGRGRHLLSSTCGASKRASRTDLGSSALDCCDNGQPIGLGRHPPGEGAGATAGDPAALDRCDKPGARHTTCQSGRICPGAVSRRTGRCRGPASACRSSIAPGAASHGTTRRPSAGTGPPPKKALPKRNSSSARSTTPATGGPRDPFEAVRWYRFAAQQGLRAGAVQSRLYARKRRGRAGRLCEGLYVVQHFRGDPVAGPSARPREMLRGRRRNC